MQKNFGLGIKFDLVSVNMLVCMCVCKSETFIKC